MASRCLVTVASATSKALAPALSSICERVNNVLNTTNPSAAVRTNQLELLVSRHMWPGAACMCTIGREGIISVSGFKFSCGRTVYVVDNCIAVLELSPPLRRWCSVSCLVWIVQCACRIHTNRVVLKRYGFTISLDSDDSIDVTLFVSLTRECPWCARPFRGYFDTTVSWKSARASKTLISGGASLWGWSRHPCPLGLATESRRASALRM